jgi:hypothetical protein
MLVQWQLLSSGMWLYADIINVYIISILFFLVLLLLLLLLNRIWNGVVLTCVRTYPNYFLRKSLKRMFIFSYYTCSLCYSRDSNAISSIQCNTHSHFRDRTHFYFNFSTQNDPRSSQLNHGHSVCWVLREKLMLSCRLGCIFLSSPPRRPDRLWVALNFLSNGYRRLFRQGITSRVWR